MTIDFSAATNDVSQQVDALIAGGTPRSQITIYCAAFDEVIDVFHRAQSLDGLVSASG